MPKRLLPQLFGHVHVSSWPYFMQILVFNANSVDPDQTPRFAASDLRLYCWPMSLLWDARRLRYVFGLARRGSTIGFRLLWRAVGLAVGARLCLLWWLVWFLCFRFGALAGLGAFVRAGFLCICVLRVASRPRVKFASCKSALNPSVVCSAGLSGAVVLLLVALWFILRGDLLCVFPCVVLFWCFSVLLVLRLPRLGKRELILMLFVRLFGLCLFRFVGFLFLLGSGKGCGLWLWHSLDFSLTFF